MVTHITKISIIRPLQQRLFYRKEANLVHTHRHTKNNTHNPNTCKDYKSPCEMLSTVKNCMTKNSGYKLRWKKLIV